MGNQSGEPKIPTLSHDWTNIQQWKKDDDDAKAATDAAANATTEAANKAATKAATDAATKATEAANATANLKISSLDAEIRAFKENSLDPTFDEQVVMIVNKSERVALDGEGWDKDKNEGKMNSWTFSRNNANQRLRLRRVNKNSLSSPWEIVGTSATRDTRCAYVIGPNDRFLRLKTSVEAPVERKQWTFEWVEGAFFRIKNIHTGQYIYTRTPNEGTDAQMAESISVEPRAKDDQKEEKDKQLWRIERLLFTSHWTDDVPGRHLSHTYNKREFMITTISGLFSLDLGGVKDDRAYFNDSDQKVIFRRVKLETLNDNWDSPWTITACKALSSQNLGLWSLPDNDKVVVRKHSNNGDKDNHWYIKATDLGAYRIQNEASRKYLTVASFENFKPELENLTCSNPEPTAGGRQLFCIVPTFET